MMSYWVEAIVAILVMLCFWLIHRCVQLQRERDAIREASVRLMKAHATLEKLDKHFLTRAEAEALKEDAWVSAGGEGDAETLMVLPTGWFCRDAGSDPESYIAVWRAVMYGRAAVLGERFGKDVQNIIEDGIDTAERACHAMSARDDEESTPVPTFAEWKERLIQEIGANLGLSLDKAPEVGAGESDSAQWYRKMREDYRRVVAEWAPVGKALFEEWWKRHGAEAMAGEALPAAAEQREAGEEGTKSPAPDDTAARRAPGPTTATGPVSRTAYEIQRLDNERLRERLRENETRLARANDELRVFYEAAELDVQRLQIVMTRHRVIDAGGGEIWRKIAGEAAEAHAES